MLVVLYAKRTRLLACVSSEGIHPDGARAVHAEHFAGGIPSLGRQGLVHAVRGRQGGGQANISEDVCGVSEQRFDARWGASY